MAKYMTIKDLKDDVNSWHERWDDWIVLVNDEPIEELDIQITTEDTAYADRDEE